MSLDLISSAQGMGIARAPKEDAVVAVLAEAAAHTALPQDVEIRLLQTELSYESDGQGILTALARVEGYAHVDVLSRPQRDVTVRVTVTDENGARVATSTVYCRVRAMPVRGADDRMRAAI